MATLQQAAEARDQAFDLLQKVLGVRPQSAGILQRTVNDFAIDVVLPRAPEIPPPVEVCGVPVTYRVALTDPQLLNAPAPRWLTRSRERSGRR